MSILAYIVFELFFFKVFVLFEAGLNLLMDPKVIFMAYKL